MSDHPKEADRELKRIVICADVCLAVFRWLPPAKVGLELALVSCRFDALVDAHFRSRRWALGKLEIVKSNMGYGVQIVKIGENGLSQTLPIPQTPLPNGVVGFGRIDCRYASYASDDVIAFFQGIGRLFQSDITLELSGSLGPFFPKFIWPLLNPSIAIVKIQYEMDADFQCFRYFISPSVLRDCANLRQITFLLGVPLEFPPDDSAEACDGQALCKWLHTPLADGRPKVLKTRRPPVHFIMEQLKTEFLSASTGANFIIVFYSYALTFEAENSLTNERLTMRRIGARQWMLVRCPIDRNADQWAEWEREALEEKGIIDWKLLGLS